MLYVGLDQHKKHSYCTVKGEEGEVVFQGKVLSTPSGIDNFLDNFKDEKLVVALEAGSSWYWLYDLLDEKVARVDLVNPKACKAIASAKLKNDKMDSVTLANLLKADLLPTCYIPSKQERYFREIVRQRAFLSRIRTRVKNRIHSILAKLGITHEFSDLFGKKARKFLEDLSLNLPFAYQEELRGLLKILDSLNREIEEITKTIDSLCKESPEASLIEKIAGIGYYTALLVVSEIGDISRFANAKKLFSYAGIIPSEKSSGERIKRGPITKEGSSWLRWALIEAAQKQAWMKDSPFSAEFKRIAKKKGNKIAKVAIARKILKTIYEMLKEHRLETARVRGGLPVFHGLS
jgi:transposase